MGLFFLPPLRTCFSCILHCASEADGVSPPRSEALLHYTTTVRLPGTSCALKQRESWRNQTKTNVQDDPSCHGCTGLYKTSTVENSENQISCDVFEVWRCNTGRAGVAKCVSNM